MNELKIDHFLKYKFLSSLQSNPSKNRMAFSVSKADVKKNVYQHDLWVGDGEKQQKVVSMKTKNQFVFETDDSLLLAYEKTKSEEKKVKEEKRTIFYRFQLNDEKLSLAYEIPFPASIIKVLPDYLLLQAALSSEEHHLYLDNESQRELFLKDQKKGNLYEDINELPFYSNGNGFVSGKRNQLFLFHKTNHSLRPLVDSAFHVGITKISDDLDFIYYTGSEMKGVKRLTTHVFVYQVSTNQTRILYHEDDCSISNMYLINDQVVIAGTDMKDFGINQNPDFFILKNKKLELLTVYRGSLSNSIGSDVRLGSNNKDFIIGDKLYFVSTIEDHSEIYSLDLRGQLKKEFELNGSIDGLVHINQTIFGILLYKQSLQDIYQICLEKNSQIQRSFFNKNVLKNIYIAKPKEIVIKNQAIKKAYVLLPKDYDDKKKYPAILDIHGGPKTVYGKVFYHEMQYWANLGYFVFFGNPRGSDGHGDEYADIRGRYGTIDFDDLMTVTDAVINRFQAIDIRRLYVTGGSYGGFMTNWIVGHTDRFKAAATQRSISNWLSFHGTSDIGFYFSKDQTDGHPLKDLEKLWEQSPIKYAFNVKTPVLFIHSDQDYRCPIEQAMQFYAVLKEKGVDTKLVWFKGENHELSRSGKPQARVKRLNEMTSWFEKHQ